MSESRAIGFGDATAYSQRLDSQHLPGAHYWLRLMEGYIRHLTIILLCAAVVALVVAGYYWAQTVRHVRPELKGKVVFRGILDSIHPRYYAEAGLRYRRKTIIAYITMIALALAAIVSDFIVGALASV